MGASKEKEGGAGIKRSKLSCKVDDQQGCTEQHRETSKEKEGGAGD